MCQQENITTTLHIKGCKGKALSITWLEAMCNQWKNLCWEEKKRECNYSIFPKWTNFLNPQWTKPCSTDLAIDWIEYPFTSPSLLQNSQQKYLLSLLALCKQQWVTSGFSQFILVLLISNLLCPNCNCNGSVSSSHNLSAADIWC